MSRLRRWMSAAALSALLVTTTYTMPTQAAGPIPLARALAKAHGAVSALAVDMQVLAQWANAAAGRGLPYYQDRLVYYQGRLAHNKASADVIRVAVQAEADDKLIQTQCTISGRKGDKR